jgi:hypothetical protein
MIFLLYGRAYYIFTDIVNVKFVVHNVNVSCRRHIFNSEVCASHGSDYAWNLLVFDSM